MASSLAADPAAGLAQETASVSAAGSLIPLPAGQEAFTYAATTTPLSSIDPADAMPVEVNLSSLTGGTIDMQVNIGEFAGPVDVYLTLYSPVEKPFAPVDVYVLQPDNTFKPVGTEEQGQPEWSPGRRELQK